MPFLVDNFRGDDQIIVNDGTINTADTTLSLIGKGAEVYGEKLNENFYHLLENFASDGPVAGPANAKKGQLWFHLDADGVGLHRLKILGDDTGTITAGDWITLSSDSFSLPDDTALGGKFLQTDGAGNLTWESALTELIDDPSPVLAGWLDANNQRIFNLSAPINLSDATNKNYVDTEIASIDLVAIATGTFVEIAGGDPGAAMTGMIFNLNANDVETQLLSHGKLITDKTYLPTRGMIEGAFLQGFPSGGVSQKFDEQTLFDASDSAAQLIDGATVNWNVTNAQVAHLDLNSANGALGVIAAAANMQDGGTYLLMIKQDGAGGRNMSFINTGTGSYKWANGAAPTLTTTSNAVDIFTFVSDGTFMYGVAQQNFS